jgi:dTMP kinase
MSSDAQHSGKFVTIEGIEGVGKSTNLDFVAEHLRNRGLRVLTTREPGGTPVAEEIRDILLNSPQGSLSDISELLLMFAARSVHLESVIRPALAAGKWVVCDRFTDATFAYQGGGRGLPDAMIQQLQLIVQSDLRPDLTILLDASLEVSETRRQERGQTDRFELEQIEFFRRVRTKYLEIADREPDRVALIDAAEPLAAVQGELIKVLDTRISKYI